jgi:hypothetical protein
MDKCGPLSVVFATFTVSRIAFCEQFQVLRSSVKGDTSLDLQRGDGRRKPRACPLVLPVLIRLHSQAQTRKLVLNVHPS